MTEMIYLTEGLGLGFKKLLLTRLELKDSVQLSSIDVSSFTTLLNRNLQGVLNKYYSQVSSVNHSISALKRLNIVRLYLTKSYRGRCHALGKPVRGQRT